jgi:hypothetical protein
MEGNMNTKKQAQKWNTDSIEYNDAIRAGEKSAMELLHKIVYQTLCELGEKFGQHNIGDNDLDNSIVDEIVDEIVWFIKGMTLEYAADLANGMIWEDVITPTPAKLRRIKQAIALLEAHGWVFDAANGGVWAPKAAAAGK